MESTKLFPLLREELAVLLCHVFSQLPIRRTSSILVFAEKTHVRQWTDQVVAREAGRQNSNFSSAAGQQVGHGVLRAEVALRFL